MSWHTLTTGSNGLLFGWALVAIPMWIAMYRGYAPLFKWLWSPVVAAVLFIIAGIVGWILLAIFSLEPDRSVQMDIATATLYILTGYAGGWRISRSTPYEDHWRGSVIADGRQAQRESQKTRERRPDLLTLAGVVVSPADETKHFKFIGTTGTGKSTAIRELVEGALKRGDRAIIADPDGGYMSRFFDPRRGDIILNPFDKRSVKWDLFSEIRNPYDVEHLASALIPGSDDPASNEWRGYARTFLTAVIRRCHAGGQNDPAELWRVLTVAPTNELRPLLAGTPAQPFLEPNNARMFSSIRSVAGTSLGMLEYISGQRSIPFSVRNWVRSSSRGVLFVPYQATQIAALRGAIAAWLQLAIFEAMNQPEDDQRLWFVVDELDALGAIEGLKDALARLRKFGGRCVLGFQSIAQVSSTYGAGSAQTIVENCGNTLILRCSASEGGGTSRFASQLIGERELIRRQHSEGQHIPSMLGKGESSKSRGFSEQHVTELAVMPSEIEQLPDLAGFLKRASSPIWLRVFLPRSL